MKHYLVFDLGGTFIKYALMDEQANILEQDKEPSPLDSLENLYSTLENIAKRFEGKFEGVAISMPGRIDIEKGIAHTGGSFRFIVEENVGEALAKRLGVPVTIANDGKCAANAEIHSGALADVDSGIVIVLGTGTGGGVVLNKKVWMGATGGGGELSAFITDMKRYMEDPSISSYWASIASASGLVGTYAVKKGMDFFDNPLDGIQFFEAYDAGDEDAKAALEEFGKMVATGIFSLQSVLDTQRIAIGGGISARKEVTDIIREKVDVAYEISPFPAPFGKPEIVTCKYRNDANLIGALRFHLEYTK